MSKIQKLYKAERKLCRFGRWKKFNYLKFCYLEERLAIPLEQEMLKKKENKTHSIH